MEVGSPPVRRAVAVAFYATWSVAYKTVAWHIVRTVVASSVRRAPTKGGCARPNACGMPTALAERPVVSCRGRGWGSSEKRALVPPCPLNNTAVQDEVLRGTGTLLRACP